jgi:predicted component of type VI protein secretion system
VSAPRIRDEAPVSFLSRLGGRRPEQEPADEARFDREVLAVTRNLTAVLNSRKGTGSVVADFGLGDYEGLRAPDGTWEPHLATQDILSVLVPEIGAQVARYEPRIKDPRVAVLGRDEHLRAIFAVTGVISGRRVRFRLALHSVFRDVRVEVEAEGPPGKGS